MAYERWKQEVVRELIDQGADMIEAPHIVDENEDWFREQFDNGAFAGITATEWMAHHYITGEPKDMKSGSSPIVFTDTCGQFLNRYSLEPLIKCVSDELGVHPATIMTQSQLDQSVAYLIENAESDDAVLAISARIREACEKVSSSVEATLNPFAGAAFAKLFFSLLEGQNLPREKLNHLNSLVRTSYADEFKTTGAFKDACGVPIGGDPVHCHYAAVVCQELNISPDLIKTKSQLDKALRYLMHSTKDAEAVTALNTKFDDIEMKAFDDFIARQGLNGLPQEALSTLYASFKQGKPMTTDQMELVRKAMMARAESQAEQ